MNKAHYSREVELYLNQLCSAVRVSDSSTNPPMDATNAPSAKKKKKNLSPETRFHLDLTLCSKNKDLPGAIALYETALSQNFRFNQHHFNTLLYLCSTSIADPSLKDSAITSGFRIYDHLKSVCVTPNEATITAVARLAAAKVDGDYAFELVKIMGKYKVTPRLRTYDPALFCFCEKLEVEKAYEVEQHMGSMGVTLEEPQFSALLKVSSETGKGDRVYEYLHKLRCSVRCVTESTAKAIEDWFRSERASEVGELNWDVGRIKETTLSNGGGWHGLGFIGRGHWAVERTNVDLSGKCCTCGEQLVSVDIDYAETENFAESVAALAMEREVKSSFGDFQDWLEEHNEYDAIVDGANIGLYQQNFADGGFSLSQLDAVVKELYNRNGGKWPLIVLHNKRFRALLDHSSQRNLVEEWKDKGILYTTPHGSNDDWYWLYAAVKLKCLLVTNDEMRDHIFELLASSLFLRWKERHQVHYSFIKGNLKLQMPPLYSLVIQESENGSWHVPIAGDDDAAESKLTWLCINRPSTSESCGKLLNTETCVNGSNLDHKRNILKSCSSKREADCNGLLHDCLDSVSEKEGAADLTRKRKERAPSPSCS